MATTGAPVQEERIRSGVGLRLPHLAEVVATRPRTGWLEIHPENFLANPHAAELLEDLSKVYPISIHTVGISVGSAGRLDRRHLERIRDLVERVDPVFVSGHLAWSTHRNEYLNDLLPLPYTKESLAVVTRHIDEVQDYLGRPYLVENPASYVEFAASTIGETEFLAELAGRSGCRLLCDVSNIHVGAENMGFDAREYIDGLPAGAVEEIHLGGYTPEPEESGGGGEVLIDTHAAPISAPVWALYSYAIGRFGPKPTLIEWDNDLPVLSALVEEAAAADRIANDVMEARNAVAG